MASKTSARLLMLVSGSLMGIVGLFVNALNFLPTIAIASIRGMMGCLLLLIFLIILQQWRVIFVLLRFAPILTIFQGVIGALTIFMYFSCIQMTNNYGFAVFMLYTGPVFAVGFLWLFLHKTPTRIHLLAFTIAILGILLITDLLNPLSLSMLDISGRFFQGYASGLLAGILLGALSTSKIAIFDKLKKTETQLQPDNYERAQQLKTNYFTLNIGLATIETGILWMIYFIPSFPFLVLMQSTHWLIAIGLGLIPTALAFTFYNLALQKDDSGDILIYSYSEVLVGVILTIITTFTLSWNLLVGGLLIITANLIILKAD